MPETVKKTEEACGLEELHEQRDAAVVREGELIQELQGVLEEAEEAMNSGDSLLMQELAMRQLALPMQILSATRQRARLSRDIARHELRAAEEERQKAAEKVPPAREKERRAREAREELEARYGQCDSFCAGQRENLLRAESAARAAQQLKPEVLVERLRQERDNG